MKNQKKIEIEKADSQTLFAMALKYLQWMQEKNFTQDTLRANREHLNRFLRWCEAWDINTITQVTPDIIERYRSHIRSLRHKDNSELAPRTRFCYVKNVCRFFQWLAKNYYLLYDPCAQVEMRDPGSRLPRTAIPHEQMELIIAQADIQSELGIRDRAMMEVLYSSGVRAHELVQLSIDDADLERRTLIIVQGKGQKDRLIPLGERAAHWVKKYLHEVRPHYSNSLSEKALFLTYTGKAFSHKGISILIRKYVRSAKVTKTGACHLFRHSMATNMLENGADIRYIQEILGHSSLESTGIYTKVSIRKLKEIHTLTHPGNQEREN